MPTEQELRRVSDDFLARLDELDALERLKRESPPEGEDFVNLAERIRELALELYRASSTQADLAEEVVREVDGGATLPTPIAALDPRDPATILSEWRELERRIAAAAADDPEAEGWRSTVDALRDEYRRAFERRAESG